MKITVADDFMDVIEGGRVFGHPAQLLGQPVGGSFHRVVVAGGGVERVTQILGRAREPWALLRCTVGGLVYGVSAAVAYRVGAFARLVRRAPPGGGGLSFAGGVTSSQLIL